MKDVMIDLETFGTRANACVVQIGACYFDRVTGEIGKTFKVNVDAGSPGQGQMDSSTVYWWLEREEQARRSIGERGGKLIPIFEAMTQLNLFLAGSQCIWSHATFDFVIVSEAMKRLKIFPKFKYSSARDIRTLNDLAGVSINDFAREGTHHDGLDDAKFQVKYCVAAMAKLRNR
jgi:hypothetical protein